MSKHFSTLAKTSFEREIRGARIENVEQVLKQISTMELAPSLQLEKKPDKVVDRLLKNKVERIKIHKKERKKPVKKEKKQIIDHKFSNLTDSHIVIPGSAQYHPNFDAVLTKSPATAFTKSGLKEKKANPGECTSGEMMFQWTNNLRTISFESSPKTREPVDDRPLPSIFEPKQFLSHAKTIMKGDNKRFTYLPVDKTPAPTDYDVKTSTFSKRAISFDKQASRKDDIGLGHRYYAHTGSNIDATKPRTHLPIPFDKQAPRERTPSRTNDIWDDVEAEQLRILDMIFKDSHKEQPKKRPTSSFEKQTPRPPYLFPDEEASIRA